MHVWGRKSICFPSRGPSCDRGSGRRNMERARDSLGLEIPEFSVLLLWRFKLSLNEVAPSLPSSPLSPSLRNYSSISFTVKSGQ